MVVTSQHFAPQALVLGRANEVVMRSRDARAAAPSLEDSARAGRVDSGVGRDPRPPLPDAGALPRDLPPLVEGVPPQMIAATGADPYAHAVESHVLVRETLPDRAVETPR